MDIQEPQPNSSSITNPDYHKKVNSIYLRVPQLKDDFEPANELKNIRKLPKEKRKRALSEFKKNLTHQTEALAYLRILLEEIFEHNPKATKEDLNQILEEVASKYGVVPEIKSKYISILDQAFEEKEKILKLNDSYPDKAELFELVSGKKLKHPELIKTVSHPMALVFYISKKDVESFQTISHRNPLGFHNESKYLDLINSKISFIVIFYDPEDKELTSKQDAILEHEIQHSKFKLFHEQDPPEVMKYLIYFNLVMPIIRGKIESVYKLKRNLISNSDTPLKAKIEAEIESLEKEIQESANKYINIMELYLLQAENFALDKAKNELIAQKRNSIIPFDKDRIAINYNFSGIGEISDSLFRSNSYFKPYFGDLIKKIYRFDTKIKMNFVRASDSFDLLIKKGHFTAQEATALLTLTPLKYWPKEVERILVKRKKDLKKNFPLNN